jgi:hypothetical protein
MINKTLQLIVFDGFAIENYCLFLVSQTSIPANTSNLNIN